MRRCCGPTRAVACFHYSLESLHNRGFHWSSERMSPTDRRTRSPGAVRPPTGLTPAQVDRRPADRTPRPQQADARRTNRPGRRRRPAAGRELARPRADRPLRLLAYDRTCVRHAPLGPLCGRDDSAVGRTLNPRRPRLAGRFRIPERAAERTEGEVRGPCSDRTACPARRPARGPRRWRSGKERRPPITHPVVAVRLGTRPSRRGQPRRLRIAAVSRAFPGGPPDGRALGRAAVRAPAGVRRLGDTADLGPGRGPPARRPTGGALTARPRRGDRRRARRRVAAGHGVGKRKVWEVAAGRGRGPRRRHPLICKGVAGRQDRRVAETRPGRGSTGRPAPT
jgi:hypothetical protein